MAKRLHKAPAMMVRISFVDTPDEYRLGIEGKLATEDVSELQSIWDHIRKHTCGRKMVVDLNNVISIHRSAYPLLSSMMSSGVDVVVSGVFDRHVLEQLKRNAPSGD
jgi:hypothetical protein